MKDDLIKRSDAIEAMEQRYQDILRIFKRKVKVGEKAIALDMIGCIKSLPSADRPQGEWVEKPHKVYLPRDYEPDINDYRDRQYNEEDRSVIQYWWHCNQCDYEADRWTKPTFNFCPNCGARMLKGIDDEISDEHSTK